MTYQNFWDAVRAVIRGKYMIHLKELEEQNQSKFSRRKEVINTRAELSEIENKRLYKKLIQQGAGSLKRLIKLKKLAGLTKEKKRPI